jgi:hypothetical protein
MFLHKYHIIHSIHYYPRLHVTAVGLGTYYPWIRGVQLYMTGLKFTNLKIYDEPKPSNMKMYFVHIQLLSVDEI